VFKWKKYGVLIQKASVKSSNLNCGYVFYHMFSIEK